ncbi:MAG: hypothetical protein QQN63_09885 [Nitrosopumilus sp.]
MKPTLVENPPARRIAHRRSFWEEEFDPNDFEKEQWYSFTFETTPECRSMTTSLRNYLRKTLGLNSYSDAPEGKPWHYEITERGEEKTLYVRLSAQGLIKLKKTKRQMAR